MCIRDRPGIPAIMMINTEKAPTDDINVRKAMIHALNHEELSLIHISEPTRPY